MTKKEFQAWKEVTEQSRHQWIVDRVMQSNGTFLAYRGGTSGSFVMIDTDGSASVGTYSGAIPHIGEAAFKVLHSRQFPSQNAAVKALIERAGLNFLLDILGAGTGLSYSGHSNHSSAGRWNPLPLR